MVSTKEKHLRARRRSGEGKTLNKHEHVERDADGAIVPEPLVRAAARVPTLIRGVAEAEDAGEDDAGGDTTSSRSVSRGC